MILESNNEKAITNIGNVHTVKIEANATMFELLSSRLYSDKPMAVLRELSTNAVDAQIEADFTGAFDVHLPTRFEPYVSIRDYGVGMSNDSVIEIYGTMGASTKRDSNAYNGALGVGSKSPFAYTAGSAFTVTSFYNGTKTIYSVFADNGIPSIAELGSMETTESNGVDIAVPVQVHDINKFTEAASKLYRYFSVKPKVNIQLDLDIGNVLYEGTNWKLYDEQFAPVLVMANVAYPLDTFHIKDIKAIRMSGLVIYAETGTVQFAASRESLSYTTSTFEVLNQFDNDILKTLLAEVDTLTEKHKNSLVDLSIALRGLPLVIRSAINSRAFHKYIRTGFNFEIRNDNFKFITTGNFNGKANIKFSIEGRHLKGKTIILADSTPAALELTKHYTNSVTLSYNQLIKDFGGKSEALTQMKAFADAIGEPYVLASEERIRIFGGRTLVSKGTITSNTLYIAKGFSWDPTKYNNNYYVSNEHKVSLANKPHTIGIPVLNNKFTTVDFNTELPASFSNVYAILSHFNYQKPLTFVAIPKTHKRHMDNTTDIFTFLKSLGDLVINYSPNSLISVLNTKGWYYRITDEKLPKDFYEYILESVAILQDTTELSATRVADSLKQFNHPVKLVENKLSTMSALAHEKYKPLNICRFSLGNSEELNYFSELVHALNK